MKRHALVALALTIVLSTAVAQNSANPARVGAAPPEAATQISTLLQQQVEAWNKHDLEAFMAGYWHSPGLTFFSGGTVTKGWEPTLERYRERYQSQGSEMGKLTMTGIEVAELGPDAACVTGQWRLEMPNGKTPHGLYTLVLRKFPEGWRIVHDHTSAAQ
jgi:beta-aspartyl-peptidase (threonine type)